MATKTPHKTPHKTPSKAHPKATETTAKAKAQRTKAVAEAQAADAAANASAVKSEAVGVKTTTVDAGGGILVDVSESNQPATLATTPPTVPTGAKKPRKATQEATGGEGGKMSGLDAAAKVLAENGAPMTCKDIVGKMLAQGLWTTHGKTPAATLYSAMLREIDGKPGASRFVKTGRGLFGLTSAK